jgi:prepilin-type N-terminal cleavage/methylation domain-containing protein
MKSPNMKNNFSIRSTRNAGTKGFTLLEFLVAMAVFMVVTGSVFSLFRKDDPLFTAQQNVGGLNMALQNSITQLQMDAVNAGSGFYAGTNIPNFPVGITIAENQVAGVVTAPAVGDCGDNSGFLYHADCFDTLNIITTDPATAPQHLDGAAPTHCASTMSGSMILLPPAGLNAAQITAWASALAPKYVKGDTLLLLTSDGSQMTTVNLTTNTPAVASATTVTITFQAQTTAGVNPNDQLLITTHSGGTLDNQHTQIGSSFCNNDWVLRLQPIVYKVDDSNPADPKLTRTLGSNLPDVIAEQIVGFKVGASLSNFAATADGTYVYDASLFGQGCTGLPGCPGPGFDFSIIRSIRVSVIGRTPPNASSAGTVLNSYDNGPYQIQGLSVVINPRNLSMTDK